MSDNTERFPGDNRLNKPSDFKKVFTTAQRYAAKKLLVLARKNDMECARLGLAISAKRIRTAVRRNKLKRIIRESFRRNKDRLKGLDIVVVAQKDTDKENSARLSRVLSGLWDRLA